MVSHKLKRLVALGHKQHPVKEQNIPWLLDGLSGRSPSCPSLYRRNHLPACCLLTAWGSLAWFLNFVNGKSYSIYLLKSGSSHPVPCRRDSSCCSVPLWIVGTHCSTVVHCMNAPQLLCSSWYWWAVGQFLSWGHYQQSQYKSWLGEYMFVIPVSWLLTILQLPFCFLRLGSLTGPQTCWSFCLSLLKAHIKDIYHRTWLQRRLWK